MCAVILVFAFGMSLVINLIERAIVHHNNADNKKEPEKALVSRNAE